jgi:serine/threonine-protein kinase
MAGPEEMLDIGVRAGDLVAGKYKVERVLGVGGMGVVVVAHHVALDTKVAIKFLLADMLSNQEAVARFAREARAAVKITSEHVARVMDVGTLDTGAPYMVMEYLDGGDLAAWLEQRGPLPVDQAVAFVLQACVAVAEAHGLGIVHRDIKPSNLFCIRRPDGQLSIKVLDFGISKVSSAARASDSARRSVTKTATVMGTPAYMAPEQVKSAKDVDVRADIWALGVVLFELLTGRVPFDGDAAMEIAIKVVTESPLSVRLLRPDISPELESVILTCLEKDRKDRFPNVAELALALAEFAPSSAKGSIERITNTIRAGRVSTRAGPLPPSPQATHTVIAPETVAPVGQTTTSLRTAPTVPRIRLVAWIALIVAVLAVAGFALLLSRKRVLPEPDVMTATRSSIALTPAAYQSSNAWSPSKVPVESATLAPLPFADAAFPMVVTPAMPIPSAAPGASLARVQPPVSGQSVGVEALPKVGSPSPPVLQRAPIDIDEVKESRKAVSAPNAPPPAPTASVVRSASTSTRPISASPTLSRGTPAPESDPLAP